MVVLSFGMVLLHSMPHRTGLCYSFIPKTARKILLSALGDFQTTIFIFPPPNTFAGSQCRIQQEEMQQETLAHIQEKWQQ